jgi:3-deoxy-D-manno-octulosonic-acid transferase
MSAGLMLRLYRLATWILEPLVPRLLQARVKRGKEDAARLGERLGHSLLPRPTGPLVWIHGASVGESLSHLPLIDHLRHERPDLTLLVTSGTRTSAELLAARLPKGVIHHYVPIDAPRAATRFLDHWQPSAAIFVESELWPNLILEAKSRNIRLALLSARMTEASAKGWARFPKAAKTLLSAFDLIQAQERASAERITALGGTVQGLANLKSLALPLDYDSKVLEALRPGIAGRAVVLAASTHEGEDEIMLRAYATLADPKPLLILAPRHPERGPAVEQLARDQGLRVARRGANDPLEPSTQVYIADTLGEMGLFYRLATLAIICGSFLPGIGGHNPLEGARLGVTMMCGNQVFNFAELCADMEAAQGLVLVASEPQLMTALNDLLTYSDKAKALGAAAARFAARDVGQMATIWQALLPLLPSCEAGA